MILPLRGAIRETTRLRRRRGFESIGKAVLAAAAFGMLAACAGQAGWSQTGMSPAQTATALADCQKQAQAALQRDINVMSDTLATRGLDWQQTGVLSIHLQEFSAELQQRTDTLIDRCMTSKGFVKGS